MRALANSAFAMTFTFTMSATGAFVHRLRPSGGLIHTLAHEWGVGICRACSIKLWVEGADAIDWNRPLIVMANHQSFLDVPVLYAALPQTFGMLAKSELFHIPILRSAMRGVGCIPIDRRNRRRSFDALCEAATEVRNGRSLIVFPEGTRSTDGRIRPLKKGPFYLAEQARVDIVPLGISGTRDALPRGGVLIRPAEVRVRIGAAIAPQDREAAENRDLRAVVRQALVELSGNEPLPPEESMEAAA